MTSGGFYSFELFLAKHSSFSQAGEKAVPRVSFDGQHLGW